MHRSGGTYGTVGYFALRSVDVPPHKPEGTVDTVLGVVEKSFGGVNSTVFRQVNKARDWWKLPTPIALLNLRALRDDLREYNLYDTRTPGERTPSEDLPPYRTYDGADQDPYDPEMGKVGTRFGRNAPIDATAPEPLPERMEPNPRLVASKLMHRDVFKPATTLNVLAACWIQFQNHGWFGHGENSPSEYIDIELDDNDEWPEGTPMRVRATSPDRSRADTEGDPPTYVNTVTHWWDGSQIYGSTEARNRELRTGASGKLIVEDGMLPNESDKKLDGVDRTGFADNYWIGLSLLHTLFVKEHNAICDHLASVHPTWDDEKLFLTARLVNAALMAKIHTVEWTPGILNTPVLDRAMNANWYGVLPRWTREKFGHLGTEMIGGIVGSAQDHGTAPYAITEEFISVYRLHPLIPDDYEIRDHTDDSLIDTVDFDPIQGKGTRPTIRRYGWSNLLYSFGVANPGAITLKNHPKALTDHVRLNGDRVDLATIDIVRDRERGVPRYNDFREKLRKSRITRFEDLTDDPELAEAIREVYNDDIDRVDLQVGMLAETPPPGFGFSDTAFRIFILMASRRLKSDRFYTDDYTPEVYTPEGIRWIETNNMTDVLLRHHPELAPALDGVANAFAPWNRIAE
ncbi:peroxidase [Antrihabitans cavernicola]|uniref:Peroxidase n=2 Tax=Antrihabitans cavernicola TaxID=2495913 RepID=A0A5A7SGU6_9NOCA|nr:peroxidase [Spelaeibacter cavernicola]